MLDKNALNTAPSNLPVYRYSLTANVALVQSDEYYEIKGYSFDSITVLVNQPLRVGDVVSVNSCYFGNKNTEIIPHISKKRYLGQSNIELEYYCGIEITKLTLNFVDPGNYDSHSSCGYGSCLVFIELSDSSLSDEERCQADTSSLNYWKSRISSWEENFKHGVKLPKSLVY